MTLEQNYRSTQPILDAANAVIELAEERFTKNLWSERASGERPQLVSVRDETDQARYVVEGVLQSREQGIALKAQAVLFRASHHSGPLEVELTRRNIPFVKFGGLKFLEAAHVKDMLAFLRLAENPRDRVAGFRVVQLLPGMGPATAAQRARPYRPTAPIRSKPCAHSSRPRRRPSIGRISSRRCGCCAAARRAGRPSSIWCGAGTSRICERIHDDAMLRQADLLQLVADRLDLSEPRTLSDRAHARSARCHQRPRRRAAARRGLSDPLDHPFGEGAGVEVGLCAQCRRRLHAVRSRHRDQRRDRGGAAAALCRHDARQGPSASDRAAALLRPRPAQATATATFTPRARASFRRRCSTSSNAAPGRAPAAGEAAAKPARAPIDLRERVRRSWG